MDTAGRHASTRQIWSRRDHRAYGTTVLVVGIGWFLLGLVVALTRDLSIAHYLIKIFVARYRRPPR